MKNKKKKQVPMSTSLIAPMDSILNLALMMFFQETFYLRQKMEHMS